MLGSDCDGAVRTCHKHAVLHTCHCLLGHAARDHACAGVHPQVRPSQAGSNHHNHQHHQRQTPPSAEAPAPATCPSPATGPRHHPCMCPVAPWRPSQVLSPVHQITHVWSTVFVNQPLILVHCMPSIKVCILMMAMQALPYVQDHKSTMSSVNSVTFMCLHPQVLAPFPQAPAAWGV